MSPTPDARPRARDPHPAIAKHAFQVHGVDGAGHVLFRKRITRVKLLSFLAAQTGVSSRWKPVLARTAGRVGSLSWAHLHDRHVRTIGQLREHAAHDVRTGHETVRVLVVLVRADAVEATLCGIEQLVDRPILVLTHAPRVGEFPPRRRDPYGLVAGLEVGRQLDDAASGGTY